jgi:tRNA (guanine37-N1)-methyltransferase
MDIKIITLFPNEMKTIFLKGLFKKAIENSLFSIEFIDLRAFSFDKHNRVDDYPFAYKKGMLLKADVIYRAVTSIKNYMDYTILYTCPKGDVFSQDMATNFLKNENIIILAGYYKGVDERIFDLLPIRRVSIGDFILSSGELPALMMTEAIIRQIPGVVGHPNCVEEDSILSGLLYPPEYTYPRDVEGKEVPKVLLGGNHKEINKWRRKEALKETLFKKPHLLVKYNTNLEDKLILTDILKEI